MKKFLTLIIILFATFAVADTVEEKSLISVTGEAKTEVVPDEAFVSMTVEVNGKDLKAAQYKNDEITDKILKITKIKLHVDDKDVQTNYINVRPVYEYLNNCGGKRCSTPTFTHFETKKGITITLKKIDDLQELLERSIEAGVTRIDNVQFLASNYEELEDKAQLAAVRNAKEKAQNIAKNLGVRLGGAHRVYATSAGSPSPMYRSSGVMAMADTMVASPVDTIALGQITIISNVNVDFEIED